MSEKWLVFTVVSMSCLIVALMLVIQPDDVIEFILIGLFSMTALVLAYIAGWAYGTARGRQANRTTLNALLDHIKAAENSKHLYSNTDGFEFGRMITLKELYSMIYKAKNSI